MSVTCPECEWQCDDNDIYCPACGRSLIGTVGVTTPPPATPDSQDQMLPADERDFIPLTFETHGSGYRRWLLPGLGLVVLLAVGIALGMEWYGGNEDIDLADVPVVIDGSFGASPPAASPIPTGNARGAAFAATSTTADTLPASPSATVVAPTGTIEASTPVDAPPPRDGTGGAI